MTSLTIRFALTVLSLLGSACVFASDAAKLPWDREVVLPIWPAADAQEGAPALTLKMPATETWQHWCDEPQDEWAEYDIYSFCNSYSPTLVLEDKFSQKVLRNMQLGTLNLLQRTHLIEMLRWTGIEEKLLSDRGDILSGMSLEFEPGMEDAYLHLKYYFR